MGIIHQSIPISSTLLLPEEQRNKYFSALENMPKVIRTILFQPSTGAYIRGLTKVYNLPLEKAPIIALVTLEAFLGFGQLTKLASMLSSKLGIANDLSQRISTDIEKELFAPVMLEYNTYISNLKVRPAQSTGGAANVLNLKKPGLSAPPARPLRQNPPFLPKSGPALGSLGTSSRPTLPKPPQPNMLK